MKAKLHQIECNKDEVLELLEDWIPVRPEHNEHATPNRRAHILYVLARAGAVDGSASPHPRRSALGDP